MSSRRDNAAEFDAELRSVLISALTKEVGSRKSVGNGFVIRQFPTETHLQPCVEAASQFVQDHPEHGFLVVIGSNAVPTAEPGEGVHVLRPHEAAALATSSRNSTKPLLYICEVDTPGASGLDEDVLYPLRGDRLARWYAGAHDLSLLAEAAQSGAAAVRLRLEEQSAEDLARYGLAVKAATAGTGVTRLSESAAFPLLGMLPDKLSAHPSVRPNSRWIQTFENLDGIKVTHKLRAARDALRGLSGVQRSEAEEALRRRLLPVEYQGMRDAVKIAADLAAAAADYASGVVEAQDKLQGLSGNLLRLLRRGPDILEALLELSAPEDDTGDEDPTLSDRPRKESVAIEELGKPLVDREEDWSQVQVEGEENDSPPVTLLPSRPPTFARYLARVAPPELWRFGGQVHLTDDAPFIADAPTEREWSPRFHPYSPSITAGLPPPVIDLLRSFHGARARLLQGAANLTPMEAGNASSPEGVEQSGDADAVVFLDAFPLLAATHLAGPCREYVEAYSALVRGVAHDPVARTHGAFVTWLMNLDLAVQEPAVHRRARLLPTHPMRVEQARLRLQLGVDPPEFPSPLVLYSNGPLTRLVPDGGGRYSEQHPLQPTSAGVAHGARLGLEATWRLLAHSDMRRALRVELRGLQDPSAATNAVAERFLEVTEQSLSSRDAAHLEVVVTASPNGTPRPIDLESLGAEAAGLVAEIPGFGVSMSIGHEPQQTGARKAHLVIEEATCFVAAPPAAAVPAGRGPGTWVRYEPGPQGNIQRIVAEGCDVEDARRELDEVMDGAAPKVAVSPPDLSPKFGDALVHTVIARNGWPVALDAAAGILTYDVDRAENYVTVMADPSVFSSTLEEEYRRALPALFDGSSNLSLGDLSRATLLLHALRQTQLMALGAGVEARTALRGNLGELKAFTAVMDESPQSLVVDLDSPSAHAWSAFHARAYGSKSHADLLVLEPEGGDEGGLSRVRLIELKVRQAAPATPEGRAALARQAVLTSVRVEAAFAGKADNQTHCENVEGLRRICWLEAGRQRRAWEMRPCLDDLDDRLATGRQPAISVECWIVPDAPWTGDAEFSEGVQSLDANAQQLDSTTEVKFRVLGPLIAEPIGTDAAPLADSDTEAETVAREGSPDAHSAGGPPQAADSRPDHAAGPPSAPPPARPSILFGATMDAKAISGRPSDEENRNMMVTGSTGTGKTQLVKAMVLQLRRQGAPALILDFKNDYASDETFCEIAKLERIFVRFTGLPYNPLIPPRLTNPATGKEYISVSDQVQGLAATLRSTYRLGVQQERRLKEAMRAAYGSMGVAARGDQPVKEGQEYPDFSQVGELLQELDGNAYGRLDPLFDLDLFKADYRSSPFEQLLGRAIVLDFSQLPSDEIKAALAKMFLISAHGYYNALTHSQQARQFFVFDEAHRMKDEPRLERFVRECRAYGVGVIVSSQYPTDFTSEVSAALATKMAHGNGPDADHVKGIAKLFGLKGREAAIAGLLKFQMIVRSSKFGPNFARSLNYIALLALDYLCGHPEGSSPEQVALSPGLDPTKTAPLEILEHLRGMGFASLREDGLWVANSEICELLGGRHS